MPVVIHRQVAVSLGGNVQWPVKAHRILQVGGAQYVKLQPWDCTLVRLVCEGIVESVPKNATMAQTYGFTELMRLRNEAQAAELSQADRPAVSLLFDNPEPQNKRKKQRSKETIRKMRESPDVVNVRLPTEVDGVPAEISMVRPVHPNDDIAVRLDESTLDNVLGFIRDKGITADDLTLKRAYKASGSKGVWRKGTGFVVKLGTDLTNSGGAAPKFKRVKTVVGGVNALERPDDADCALSADAADADAEASADSELGQVSGDETPAV